MGIYAIWGAPQSGKTTLAVNLAYAISKGDKTVCLISPESYSELSAILGIKIPEEHSLRAALRGGVASAASSPVAAPLLALPVLLAAAGRDGAPRGVGAQPACEIQDLASVIRRVRCAADQRL